MRMRKYVLALVWIISIPALALHVECIGEAKQLTLKGDTLLLFVANPELKTKQSVGNVEWYRLPDTIHPIQASSSYLDYSLGLRHGEGYMIKKGNIRDVFWVFDYEQLRPSVIQVDAELSCENTVLTLQGEVPDMRYVRLNGQAAEYPRTCQITYRDAAWDATNEIWVDSIVVEEKEFATNMVVGASPVATDYVISDVLAQQLQVEEDIPPSLEYEPVALKAHPKTITTTRGKKGETSNEVNRPYTKDDVENMSAPLEVLFESNGLNADYYQWKIYRGSELLLSRSDAEHRYTFMDSGVYRAVVLISNQDCALDSTEFKISVSESMLLVPNVFTPNGDGANDEFRVAYRSLKEFHCEVYNRWGTLVYSWDDPAKGWDGKIGGKPAAEGAYFYVIRALGTDAAVNAQYMSKPAYKSKVKNQDESILGVYQLSGSINLIRGGK